MAVFDQGGGGGKGGSSTEDLYGLAKPYDIVGKFTPEMAAQINEMFETLFKNVTRGEDKEISLQSQVDNLTAPWTELIKLTTTSITNSTTFTADPFLIVPMIAGARYMIRGVIMYQYDGATGDMKHRFNSTGTLTTPSMIFRQASAQTTGTSVAGGGELFDTVIPTAQQAHTSGVAGTGTNNLVMVSLEANILANAAGDFGPEYAQINLHNGDKVNCLAGSWIEYRKVT